MLPLPEVEAGFWQVWLAMDRGAGWQMQQGVCDDLGCSAACATALDVPAAEVTVWSSNAPKCSVFQLLLSLLMSSNFKKT